MEVLAGAEVLVEGKRLLPRPPAGVALVVVAVAVEAGGAEVDDWPPRVKPPRVGAGLLAAEKRLGVDPVEVTVVPLWPGAVVFGAKRDGVDCCCDTGWVAGVELGIEKVGLLDSVGVAVWLPCAGLEGLNVRPLVCAAGCWACLLLSPKIDVGGFPAGVKLRGGACLLACGVVEVAVPKRLVPDGAAVEVLLPAVNMLCVVFGLLCSALEEGVLFCVKLKED